MDATGRFLLKALPKFVQRVSVYKDELTVYASAAGLLPVTTLLKQATATQFTQLVDVCGADYPQKPQRFEVVYHLLSIAHNQRIRLKVATDETTPVDSLCGLFKGADWFEREAYDMYGIVFRNHPDLRRILTDYGFQGHPLRKDFPLTGYVEVRYDDQAKRVVAEPVELAQAFRVFDVQSPWQQLK